MIVSNSLAEWRKLVSEGHISAVMIVCLGVWLNASDSLVTAIIMPEIVKDLGGYRFYSWSITGFLIGALMAGFCGGWLVTVIGLRRALMISGAIMGIGCCMSAVASSFAAFLAGRVIQGVGSGWIAGLAMIAISVLFPKAHVGKMYGSTGVVWGIATVAGPILGSVLTELGSWRLVFAAFAVQAVVFSALAGIKVPVLPGSPARKDIPFSQLVILLFFSIAIGLASSASGLILSVFFTAICLVLLLSMLIVDRASNVRLFPEAMFDLGSIAAAGYGAMFVLSASSVGFLIYGPIFLQKIHGLPLAEAGRVVAIYMASWAITAIVIANFDDRNNGSRIALGSLSVFLGSIIMWAGMTESLLAVFTAAVILGFGFGLSYTPINKEVMSYLGAHESEVGGSALASVRQCGQLISSVLVGIVANMSGFSANAERHLYISASNHVLVVGVVASLAGFLISLKMALMGKKTSRISS